MIPPIPLKDCPFCGAKFALNDVKHSSIQLEMNDCHHFYVYCEECNANTGEKELDRSACNAWNKRVEPKE